MVRKARKKVFGHNAAIALGHRYSGKTRDPGERGGMPSKSVRSKNYKASKPSELPLEVAMARKGFFDRYSKGGKSNRVSTAQQLARTKAKNAIRKKLSSQ
tara:strand:+ start:25911 stop:26210 length:300 start_codon:yes stop_codon:yes gene_type:complete